jgi:SAM-dependent methyltransferase
MIDQIKEYWNNQPCNINHSKKDFLSKEYFDEVEKKKYFVEYHIPKFAEFEKYKGKRVLEIGCGIGTDSVNFARHCNEYVGLELSDVSLDITKKRFEVYGLDGTFYNINAEDDLSFLGQFDLIYSFGVIHHSPNPQKIIDNVYKLLKPGGEFKFMVYAENSWKKFMIDSKLDQFEAQSNCPCAFTYTFSDIQFMLNKFKDIKIKQEHIFPYKIDKYKQNIYEKQDYFENMTDEMFKVLEKNLGWHLCVICYKY